MKATRLTRRINAPVAAHFVKLIENEQVVETVEFETVDPAMQGEMTITITLAGANGGTELLSVPRLSLRKLAALVEAQMSLVDRHLGHLVPDPVDGRVRLPDA